ncbi:sensor histidine kinase [Streptomyces sp. NPDC057382]|uniref:sensor histidine kinase n=1 Tax=unclassified Streptomyces TaxID=2593676 RepID=UPI00363BDC99
MPWAGRRLRLWPRSVRAHSALGAALATALILTTGCWWMREETYQREIQAARQVARVQAQAITSTITATGRDDSDVVWEQPWALVTGDGGGRTKEGVPDQGAYRVASSDLVPFLEDRRPALGGPGRGPVKPADAHREYSVRFRTISKEEFARNPPAFPELRRNALAGKTVTVIAHTIVLDPAAPSSADRATHDPRSFLPRDGTRIRIYVAVAPTSAEKAVAAIDRFLLLGLPLCVVLVAVVAYLATRWALRPVEAIRRRTAEVTATNPRERVEIPDTRDEIAALAATINATLQRLDDAAAAQRRFVADASHELRSPLTTLLTSLEVGLTYPEQSDLTDTLATAARQTRRLHALAEDLLLLARLDGTPALAAHTAVDLAALADTVATDYTPRLRDGLTLHYQADGPAPVHGSPQQLERLLRNLLDNALRHARQRIEITVRATDDQDPVTSMAVVLTVRDDGPGIPAEHEQRVFERFTRLDEARNRDHGGAGLGLAIAQEIAARHQATLTLTGERPGACFTLRLAALPS